MGKLINQRRFAKHSEYGGRWHKAGEFILAEFIRDNLHDEWVIEDLVPRLRALRVGQSFTWGGGAAGLDKFTRLPSSHRWIQKALKYHKEGALHRQLGVPAGEKIPLATLREAARGGSTKKARRARFALTLRKISKRAAQHIARRLLRAKR